VTESNAKVTAKKPPLVIITSNDERELPSAFLRRCIQLNLKAPDRERLVNIAKAHFGKENVALYEKVANLIVPERDVGTKTEDEPRAQQSAAEFLDTVHACMELNVKPDSKDKTWQALSKATLWKPRELPESE
jgi:MoxR-like ATPase